ncbi:hypothetical protein LSAT2_011310 [Lamellibrachia satsuma]|nr:hypothetical protein LSAT2_011310 [Lamellibrachia satsuma]
MPERPLCDGSGTTTKTHVDLSVLVDNSRRLIVLGGPFIKLGRIATSLQRWESPRISVAVLLLSNVACFCLSTGHLLLYILLFIVSCASLGIIHERTGLLKKFFPIPPPSEESSNEDEDAQSYRIEEFKDLLVHVNTFLELSCCFLARLYNILKWSNGYYSGRFYAVLASIVVLLSTLSLRYNINLGGGYLLSLPASQSVP